MLKIFLGNLKTDVNKDVFIEGISPLMRGREPVGPVAAPNSGSHRPREGLRSRSVELQSRTVQKLKTIL